MKSFLTAFTDGILTAGLLPAWLLAVLIWRHAYKKWVWVSPKAYALKAAEIGDYLTLVVALILWGAPIVLIMIFH